MKNSSLLRGVAILQGLVMVPILIRLLVMPADFSAVGLWFIMICIAVMTLPYGLWQWFRHPERRSWAGGLVGTAVVAVVVPVLQSTLDLPPLTSTAALPMAVTLVLCGGMAWIWSSPNIVRRRIGVSDPRVARVLGIGLPIALLSLAVPLIAVVVLGPPPPLGRRGSGLDLDTLFVVSAVVIPLTAPVALLGLVSASIGLWRDRERRVAHAFRGMLAVVCLFTLLMLVSLLVILAVNPG